MKRQSETVIATALFLIIDRFWTLRTVSSWPLITILWPVTLLLFLIAGQDNIVSGQQGNVHWSGKTCWHVFLTANKKSNVKKTVRCQARVNKSSFRILSICGWLLFHASTLVPWFFIREARMEKSTTATGKGEAVPLISFFTWSVSFLSQLLMCAPRKERKVWAVRSSDFFFLFFLTWRRIISKNRKWSPHEEE